MNSTFDYKFKSTSNFFRLKKFIWKRYMQFVKKIFWSLRKIQITRKRFKMKYLSLVLHKPHLIWIWSRSSHPEVFLEKGVLKICSKFTGKHPWRSVISIKLNLMHIFTTSFLKNISGPLRLELVAITSSNREKKWFQEWLNLPNQLSFLDNFSQIIWLIFWLN